MVKKYPIEELLRRIEANWNQTATLENAVVLGLIRMSDLAIEKSTPGLAEIGLTQTEFEVLNTLRSTPEPRQLTPTELYRTVLMTSGGMTKVLKQLEAQGYVERVDNPEDKRSSFVRLTAAGADMAEKSMAVVAKGDQSLLHDALSREELEQLKGLLLKALANVER